ncbi:hypothetical protein LPU83_pLPU83d_0804 (plasmid) [Rhizobium favelukesii]|uniref:Uncharacterized protein n=1 Tax=Rhizobium favelukesii TaxID=348824 RepID=W6RN31_9HYPH|nr:hypothetical protein LPU83_pLPU83d_0804 [Rhizobium favelukesii]
MARQKLFGCTRFIDTKEERRRCHARFKGLPMDAKVRETASSNAVSNARLKTGGGCFAPSLARMNAVTND